MSISGSLEDVSVADVIQFIHLGRRRGTLVLVRGPEKARIGFHNGYLVSASAPSSAKLGDLLVSSGLVSRDALEEAAERLARDAGLRSLGQALVAAGSIEAEVLRRVVVAQIEQAVSEVLGWQTGSFEFVPETLRTVDDVALYPGDLVPEADINPQMVLLEAARILDERNRGVAVEPMDAVRRIAARSAAEADDEAPAESTIGELESRMALLEQGVSQGPSHCLQVVSADGDLCDRILDEIPPALVRVETVTHSEVRSSASDGLPVIVLVDLRNDPEGVAELLTLRQAHPLVPTITVVEEGSSLTRAYEAGALAAVPPDVEAVTACVENVIERLRELAFLRRGGHHSREGVARLQRLVGDLRSGLISATAALNLMHVVSESVERAVLFLAGRDSLAALGAFGTGVDDQPLAELTRGLQLDLGQRNALVESLETGEVRSVPFEEAGLPESLAAVLGRPASGQVVVFPVAGASRVIAVVYSDNGELDRPIEDIEILELATAQVGMAFENELLRRRLLPSDS